MIRLLSHPLTILIFSGLSLALFLSLRQNAQETGQSGEMVVQMEREVQNLEYEMASLRQETESAASALRREKIIRNELLKKKPGEEVIQMPGFEDARLPPSKPSPTPTPWEEWKELLL
jgi:negative regulator of sigma E activity